MQVQTGAADVVLAGGAESMSQAELYSTTLRWGARSGGAMLEDRLVRGRVTAGGENYPVPGGMIETAENLRREYAIPREEQDELALRSHQRAVARPGERHLRRGDRRPSRSASARPARARSTATSTRAPTPRWSSLGSLRPVMARKDPEATVTAGNASGQNDGAAMCIVTHAEKAAELGLTPDGAAGELGGGRRASQDDGHRAGARRRPRRSRAPA